MELKDIASVSGKGGLFKILSPTRTGAVLESLDNQKKKMIVGAHSKVSVLSEISIYTTDADGSKPLEEVLKKIHKEFNGDTDLNSGSAPDELKSFLKFILPEYDEARVYVSDIKKLVTWYAILVKEVPEIFAEAKKESKPKAEKTDAKAEEPKKTPKKASAPKSDAAKSKK
tara:strand:- start:63 stop:575 length:513 start_codon:yes stop_codon:yes gene_type:complete